MRYIIDIYFVLQALGGDLRSLLRARGGRLDEAEARQCARQLLTALEYCHARGVVHRGASLAVCGLGGAHVLNGLAGLGLHLSLAQT
jgi:hypothetical protein